MDKQAPAKEKTQFVSGLRPSATVADVFLAVGPEVCQTRNGDPFLKLCLADKTGAMDAVFWKPTPDHLHDAPHLQFVFVSGDVCLYGQKKQVKINALRSVAAPEDTAAFVPCSPFPLPDLLRRFAAHRATVSDRALRGLLIAVFEDARMWNRFITFPAAKANHHAFQHGLLQHTVEVADFASAMVLARRAGACDAATTPSLDLVIAGALLHDIGKTRELENTGYGYEYSRPGKLLGHISIGVQIVLARMGRDLSPVLRDSLLHILLAHHGKREYGSPQPPMTPEAVIVHAADTFSVQLWAMGEAQTGAGEGALWGVHPCLDDQPRMSNRALYLGPNGVADEEDEPENETSVGFSYPTAPLPSPYVSEERAVWSLARPWDKTGGQDNHNFAIVRVKVLGRIAAGVPLLAEEDSDEEIEIEGAFGLGQDYFALHVSGDSMTGDGIHDGDLLIARQQNAPSQGDIVVAEIVGGATGVRDGATVKRYEVDGGGEPVLVASNPNYAPLRLEPGETLRIRGVAVGVARPSAV